MEKIYNITASVDADIAPAWIKEVSASFLPALMAVPGVLDIELIEVHTPESVAPGDAKTFTLQIRFADQSYLDAFLQEQEHRVEKELSEKFGARYVTFRLHLSSLDRRKNQHGQGKG